MALHHVETQGADKLPRGARLTTACGIGVERMRFCWSDSNGTERGVTDSLQAVSCRACVKKLGPRIEEDRRRREADRAAEWRKRETEQAAARERMAEERATMLRALRAYAATNPADAEIARRLMERHGSE